MSTPEAEPVETADVFGTRHVVAPLAACLTCAFAVGLCYLFFVRTRIGQYLDWTAFRGSYLGSWRIEGEALGILSLISTAGVAAVVVLVAVIAIARRQVLLALEAAIVVIGANLTTQALKHVVLSREELVANSTLPLGNTLPSGHTTVAASAAVAALLVAPAAARSVMAFVGAVITFVFGVATLVGHWHRPSDVIAAVLVALAWAFGAIAVARLRHRLRHDALAPGRESASFTTTVTLATVGTMAFIVAGVCYTLAGGRDLRYPSEMLQMLCLVAGTTGVLAVAGLGFALLLRMVATVQAQQP